VKVLSLFSGIGGMDLGLERAGMTVVAHSEIDAYACRVLRKHWPDVPNLGDITKITEADVEQLGPIDLVAGGFPCQDLSVAGKQAGINASRSGLFWELMRIVRLARPRYVLLENVPALLSRPDWMGAVLGALAESGFDAEWDCIPAAAVGAPHRRDRVFVVAYPSQLQRDGGDDYARCRGEGERTGAEPRNGSSAPHVADADGTGPQGRGNGRRGFGEGAGKRLARARSRAVEGIWRAEPGMGDLVDGISPGLDGGWGRVAAPRVVNDALNRVARLRGLGNAVVPAVAEFIGRCIMEATP